MKNIVFHIDSTLTSLPAICRLLTRNDFWHFIPLFLLTDKGFSTIDIHLVQIAHHAALAFNDFIITDYQETSPELLHELDRQHIENYYHRY